EDPAGDVHLAVAVEVAGLDVGPGDEGVPRRPQGVAEARAGGQGHPPLAALEDAAGDVGLAVAVEVPRPDVDPCNVRVPCPERQLVDRAARGGRVQQGPRPACLPANGDVPPGAREDRNGDRVDDLYPTIHTKGRIEWHGRTRGEWDLPHQSTGHEAGGVRTV